VAAIVSSSQGLAQGKAVRLAVLPFAPTQSEYAETCSFGTYFTEGLISSLAKSPEKIRLFERSRLDALMKEHALTLSGIISEKEAKQIGELAPIDYILTGTFTKLESYIEVNGRILDVVSGEIKTTFNQRIMLSQDLASLFPAPAVRSTTETAVNRTENSAAAADDKPKCPREVTLLDSLLDDLTSQAKIDKLVSVAVTVPFTPPCGYIHADILYQFCRHKIFNPRYRAFMLNVLAGIESSDKDYWESGNRASSILAWFEADSVIDKEEWEAGLGLVKRAKTLQHIYLSHLFIFDVPQSQMDQQYARIDQYFSLAKQGQIGRPVAISMDEAFGGILYPLRDNGDAPDNRMILYLMSKYGDSLSDKNRDKVRGILEELYKDVRSKKADWQKRRALLDQICRNFNGMTPGERVGEEMLFFGRFINDKSRDKNIPVDERKSWAEHLHVFASGCSTAMAASLPLVPKGSMQKDAILFCLEHGIPARDLVPSLDDLQAQLFDESIYRQMDAGEYLRAMGASAAPAEAKVLKMLRRTDHMNASGTTNLQWSLIDILGNIKTTSPEALTLLLTYLKSSEYEVPDHAMASFVNIGKPGLAVLRAAYPASEDYVKIRIIKTFGMMGKAAATEQPFLQSQLSSAGSNYDLRDALEDALEAIKK
jgi:TolB-like protein